MGVPGIWSHVGKFSRQVPIEQLHGLTLAVDGYIWLCESSRGTASHGMSGASYLVTFFTRIQRLRENLIEPIIVFDHITSPRTRIAKRKSSGSPPPVSDMPSKLLKLQKLLTFMGVRIMLSPVDGEAQCARLEQAGVVSGCITTDFDYFLFGGKNLYKFDFSSGGKGIKAVTQTSMDDIVKEHNLTRYRLVALAILLGSDYFEGIPGVGIVTALEIISEFSIHEDDHSVSILDRFASYYRHEVVVRETDSLMKKKFRNCKIVLPTLFPNSDDFLETFDIFLCPFADQPPLDKTFFEEDLPRNIKDAERMLTNECGWNHERFAQELKKSSTKVTKLKNRECQSRMTDFFPPRHRPSVVVMTQNESKEMAIRGSKREWAALKVLREKANLYKHDEVVHNVDGSGNRPLTRSSRCYIDGNGSAEEASHSGLSAAKKPRFEATREASEDDDSVQIIEPIS